MISLFETIITPTAKAYVNKVLDSGYLNQGGFVDSLEQELFQHWSFKNPVTLNSCSAALYLALKLAGVGTDDEVIIAPQTFVGTGLAVLMAGGKVRWADVDNNGNLDSESLKLKKNKNVKAVIAIHWGGIPCDMRKLYDICRNNSIILIEDCAHAIGAKYADSVIGDCKYSDFACFSMQSIKNLTSGDGGILCCRSDEHKSQAIKMRWFGMDKSQVTRNAIGEREQLVDILGFKWHLNDYTAALALGNIIDLKERLNIKYHYAMKYYTELMGLDGIILPATNYPCRPSYWLFTIKAERRNDLIKKLNSAGIQASIVDSRIDKHPIFNGIAHELKNQAWFDTHQLSIPCTSTMTDKDQEHIIKCIKEGW